jgi:hypothetical protein
MDMWRSFFFVFLKYYGFSDALVTESLKCGVPGVTFLSLHSVWISSARNIDM